MAKLIEVDPREAMKRTTFELRYVGLGRFRFRLWLALQLFHLGVWIIGAGFEFHGIEDGDE